MRRAEIDAKVKRRADIASEHDTEFHVITGLMPEIGALEIDLRQMSRSVDFDPVIAQEWRELVAAVDRKLAKARCDTVGHILQGYGSEALETYARILYTSEPDKLPKEPFELFAPLWQLQCRETTVFLGLDHPGPKERQPDARLIDLPPNPLAGVTFGDESRFYVDIPAAALAKGRFLDAISCDTHGQY